jgi:hypothetical protein
MIRRILIVTLPIALAACGRSEDSNQAQQTTPTNSETGAVTQTSASGDPCRALTDPAAIFGQPATAHTATMPNNTHTCEWRVAGDRTCGTLVVFGPGWNEVANVPANYEGMVTSLKAFGDVKEVTGVGEEARAVDGGILGAQLAFRTNDVAALVGATCGNAERSSAALAESLARAVAENL